MSKFNKAMDILGVGTMAAIDPESTAVVLPSIEKTLIDSASPQTAPEPQCPTTEKTVPLSEIENDPMLDLPPLNEHTDEIN